MKATIKYDLVNPISPTKDETLFQLAVGAVAVGVDPIEEVEGEITYDMDNEKVPLDVAKLIVSKGGKVADYQVFIEVNPTDIVPEGMLGGGLTWEEWTQPNYEFYEKDGKFYAESNAHTGEYLNLEELIPVFDKLVVPSDLTE